MTENLIREFSVENLPKELDFLSVESEGILKLVKGCLLSCWQVGWYSNMALIFLELQIMVSKMINYRMLVIILTIISVATNLLSFYKLLD